MVCVEGTIKIKTPCHGQGLHPLDQVPQSPSSLDLNTSGHGTSTTSLENLFQRLSTLRVNNLFLSLFPVPELMAAGDKVQQGCQQAPPCLQPSHLAWHCPTWLNAEAIASFSNHSVISTHILISSIHNSKIKQWGALSFNSHLHNWLLNGQISHLSLCYKCMQDYSFKLLIYSIFSTCLYHVQRKCQWILKIPSFCLSMY